MSTKITKDFTFQTALHFENRFMINLYDMNVRMTVETDDVEEQHIAIERMIWFVTSQIEDCIFVHEKDTEAADKYHKAGMRVCLLPEEPYDQIIGLCLINKLNAIMEGRIVLQELDLGSKLSNLIKFTIDDEVAAAEYSGKHWWNDKNCTITNKKKKEKIVNLFDHKSDDWAELELTWKTK